MINKDEMIHCVTLCPYWKTPNSTNFLLCLSKPIRFWCDPGLHVDGDKRRAISNENSALHRHMQRCKAELLLDIILMSDASRWFAEAFSPGLQ